MVSPDPKKLTQIAEEIVEALGYQLFINDEDPENDPERIKFRQLVQLIEMELSAELFVTAGNPGEDGQPVADAPQITPFSTPETQSEMAKAGSAKAETATKTKSEPQPRPEPQKPAGGTQIRLVNHQEEKTSAGAAILRSLSLSSASVFGIAIAAIFLTGFLTAQYLFGDKNSAFFNSSGHTIGRRTATGPIDPKQQRAGKAFFMMGKSELEKKNYQAARESFRMALSLEPDNPQYQEAFKQVEILTKGSKKKPKP